MNAPTVGGMDPKAQVAATFDRAAATYDDVIAFFAPFGRALAAAADLDPGERVLDVACGRGSSLRPAAEAVGPTGSVVGIDLSAAMIERLAAELPPGLPVSLRQGDAEALDVPDASVDAVLGGFMIFFPPHPEQVLAELHRVLRPVGRVALSIFDGPPGFDFQHDLLAAVGTQEAASGPAAAFNRADVLDPALEAAGFVDVTGTDVIERYRFDSVDQVEQWQWSTGVRTVLAALDEPTLARYRELLAERLEAHRVGDGFELVQRARMTVARKP